MSVKWAFNSATIMHCGWDEELALWQKFGWNAVEVWASKIQPKLDAGATFGQLSAQMRDAGVLPVGLCAGMISNQGDESQWQTERDKIASLLDMAAEIGAPSLTVVIIGDVGPDLVAEYSSIAQKLHAVAEMAASRGVLVNLEFLGQAEVNGTLGSCIELINRVDHPSLGMLFDFCHYYVGASHLEELALLPPNKIFMVHVDDSPRLPMEVLRNDQRCFPGEGRINVPGLIQHFQHNAAYDGYFSIELYDEGIWKMPPLEVMSKLDASLKNIEVQLEKGMGKV